MNRKPTIDEVLMRGDVSFSAMSWDGFNIYGDEASIAEVRRLQHQDYVAEYLRKFLGTSTPDLFAEWREPGFPRDRLEAFVSQTGWPCAPPGDEK